MNIHIAVFFFIWDGKERLAIYMYIYIFNFHKGTRLCSSIILCSATLGFCYFWVTETAYWIYCKGFQINILQDNDAFFSEYASHDYKDEGSNYQHLLKYFVKFKRATCYFCGQNMYFILQDNLLGHFVHYLVAVSYERTAYY